LMLERASGREVRLERNPGQRDLRVVAQEF
jgi:hypothetical protein